MCGVGVGRWVACIYKLFGSVCASMKLNEPHHGKRAVISNSKGSAGLCVHAVSPDLFDHINGRKRENYSQRTRHVASLRGRAMRTERLIQRKG